MEAQLAAIDEVRAELTDEEIAALDITRYAAAVSALAALDGQAGNDLPMPAAEGVVVGPFTVEGGAESIDYKYENSTLTILSDMPLIISGTTKTDKIIIKNGVTANVTLKNLNIDVSGKPGTTSFEVEGNATCNLTLTGVNTLKSGKSRAGLNVGQSASLTITENSTGSLDATGGENTAGIGSGYGGTCGTITINGGTVTATGGGNYSGAGIGGGGLGAGGIITINGGIVTARGGNNYSERGAGIGGGCQGAGGIITINGGIVIASGGDSNAAGIGGGSGGDDGTFSTAPNGNAFIIASSISDNGDDKKANWSGVIFEGDEGKVYGSPELKEDATIPNGKTLTIENSKTLTIGDKATLTNDGTIKIEQGGTLSNNGTLTGNGTITGNGQLTGTKATQTAPGTGEGYTISYTNETITVDRGYEANTARSFTDTAITTGASLVDYMDSSLYIRKAESAFYAASSGTEINVPARPNAPTLTIDNEVEGVTLARDYCYNTTGEDYSTNTWTPGDGSNVIVTPRDSIYIYKAATASDFKSVVQTLTAPSRGTTPNVSINYTDETLNTTAAMQYVIGASGHGVQSWTDCNANMAATAFGNWNGSTEVTVQFRTAATRTNYASEAQSVKIPARPAAPVCQGQNESVNGKADGKISGTTTDMEYSTDGTNWTDCTDTETTGLAPGNYKVRLKATAAAFAGAAADVEIKSGAAPTYTLEVTAPTFAAITYGDAQPTAQAITIRNIGDSDAAISSVTVSGSDFTIDGSGDTVTAGGSITSWTIRPKDGLSAGEHTATITVTYNGGATATADVKFKVIGAAQAAPAAPELESKTYNRVTLKAVDPNINGAVAQYSNDGGKTWQTSPEFTGLTPSTKYTFVVRYGATQNYEESPASPALEVTTDAAPVTMYSVTVNGGTGGGSYAAGATVTITATVPNGQRFTGWTVNPASVTLANASSATTTFTMPAGNVTVTANFQSNSGGGNYDGGGTYTPPTTPTYPPTVERPSGGGGTPSTSPSNPKQGDTVTVTPKPDQGYEVDTITVIDRNGKPVEVTKKPDGTYTFKQPSGKVTVKVTYRPTDRPWNNPFTDVSEGDWYYEAVRFVQEQGLMNGYSDGRFGANDTLSRAQLAQILFNKEGRPAVSGGGFNDVDSGAWYADAVTWAAENGIVGGYGNGMFGPNDPITREQLAVMLWRYSGSPAATNKELHFNDTDEISGFALDAMRWAVENGILNGYGDGRLGPQGQATRAQVAQMLKNFFEKG